MSTYSQNSKKFQVSQHFMQDKNPRQLLKMLAKMPCKQNALKKQPLLQYHQVWADIIIGHKQETLVINLFKE